MTTKDKYNSVIDYFKRTGDTKAREKAEQEVAEWVISELNKCLEIRIYNVRELIRKIEKKYIGEVAKNE